jgi:site-specific recombinase XerD
MSTLRQQLDDYLAYARSLRRSPVHLRMLRYAVLRTLRWLDERYGVAKANQLAPHQVTAWVTAVAARRTIKGVPVKQCTVAKQLDADRTFFSWLEREGVVPASIPAAFPRIKLPDFLPSSVLAHCQMVRLLERIDIAGPAGYQLRAMLEVLYSSGVRIAELLGMDLDAVDVANATARVHGKGDKWRIVPLGRTAGRFLEGYVKGVRALRLREPTERAIWLGRDGRRLEYHVFRRQLVDLVRDAGFPVVVTAHTFRRSCATELVRGGANLWHVKDLLGHENLETLKHYTRLTIVDLKKTHARCHPRERRD